MLLQIDENHTRIENNKPIIDLIVIAKWAGGPVVKAPMSVGDYGMSHEEVYGYYCYRTLTK